MSPVPPRYAAELSTLDRVAFRSPPSDGPVTLDWFMLDYVEHRKHHLRQIERATGLQLT